MRQIEKRKKKGRPSKADLARRAEEAAQEQTESKVRRSLRRRNVRYSNFIDYDDFIDEDFEIEEEEDEEDERRREKKVKLVVKLEQAGSGRGSGHHARESGVSESEDEESERKVVKKRRISSSGYDDEEEDDEGGGDDDGGGGGGVDEEEEEEEGGGDEEDRGRKGSSKSVDSPPGTPPQSLSRIPLPDKKKLELIIDKLQKKDTYGVYAEPVDPEELPDYHDVIEHPMDFSTVRKKLANGSYTTLDQFESDVFLICSNAMTYNAPDTIYHKQARTIQELGRKKFNKLRIDYERSEKEPKSEPRVRTDVESSEKDLKSEQRSKSNFLMKRQIRKPLSRPLQEPVGSDFSAGATLASALEFQNNSAANQAGSCDRLGNNDVPGEGNTYPAENTTDRTEELSMGKGLFSRFSRKPFVLDENRRATYNVSNQPVVQSESIFTTFEGEIRQLVAVGLHAEYSYARSLARFAATLGSTAWEVASRRIEQALPAGYKFGHGWVGEYEPLPTPVLMIENHLNKDSVVTKSLQRNVDLEKNTLPSNASGIVKENTLISSPADSRKSPFHSSVSSSINSAGSKSNVTANVNVDYQKQSPVSRNPVEPENKAIQQFELNSLPSTNQNNGDYASEKKHLSNLGRAASGSRNLHNSQLDISGNATYRSQEMGPRSMNNNMQAMPSKQQDTNGLMGRDLPNGKVAKGGVDVSRKNAPNDSPKEMPKAPSPFPRQDQGLSDPVQLMRKLTENAQKQLNPSSSTTERPPAMGPVPSFRSGDASGNAAAAAACAWMSVGAGGFRQPTDNSIVQKSQTSADSPYNPTRELHPRPAQVWGEFPVPGGFLFRPEKNNIPIQAFVPSNIRSSSEAQFPNRPMVFPQLMTADLSRFQAQSPWRGIVPHTQQRQKQETLPPDLNIGFQSPGSPVKQSTGAPVDSQQPDLALQL